MQHEHEAEVLIKVTDRRTGRVEFMQALRGPEGKSHRVPIRDFELEVQIGKIHPASLAKIRIVWNEPVIEVHPDWKWYEEDQPKGGDALK